MGDATTAGVTLGRTGCGAVVGLLLLVGVAGTWVPTAMATSTTSDDAVAFRQNAKHTAALEDATLRPPLSRRWSRDLGERTFSALIAEGKIFVWAAVDSSQQGVLALDPATGETIWSRLYPSVGTMNYDSPLAYDNGRVFYVTWGGTLRALSASTGAVLWETQLASANDYYAPTASGGIVALTASGSFTERVLALDAASGRLLWGREDDCCNFDSTPAIDGTRVYVAAGCAAFAYARTDGSKRWIYGPKCRGGGGATPALYNGRLYFGYRTLGYVLDSSNGDELNTPYSLVAPTLAFGKAIHVEGYSKLVARDAATRAQRWSFEADSDIEYPPVAVGTDLYAVSEAGTLYALDLHTGALNWSGSLGHPTENAEFRPYASLTAGENILAITAFDTLEVFAPTAAPDGPETFITRQPESPTTSRDAVFEFESSDPEATFECRLDAQEVWENCTSPKNYNDLPDGEHRFSVRAVGANGNFDPTPAVATWTIGTSSGTAPDTTITSGPPQKTTQKSVVFEFTSDNEQATFECKLDGGNWKPCTSPWGSGKVSRGWHTFKVRARDPAGNVDPTPATATWKRLRE